MMGFYVGAEELNLGLHVFIPVILFTKKSISPDPEETEL